MAKWTFEPGHTAAEFCIKHMMVTWIRGCFKNVHGTLKFDLKDPVNSSVEATINAKEIWSGDSKRDKHLRSKDFLDVEKYPKITFKGNQVEMVGLYEFKVTGNLTMHGVTKRSR